MRNRTRATPHIGALLLFATVIAASCVTVSPKIPSPIEVAFRQLEATPGDITPLLDLVRYYLAQSDFLRARQYLALAERHTGARAAYEQIFRLSVSTAVRAQHYSDAIERCEQYLAEHRDLTVRVLLATLLEVSGNNPAAERQRKLILVQHPEAVEQLIELARFYERSRLPGAQQQAHESYERYLRESPQGLYFEQARAALLSLDLDSRLPR